ncbi:MAG: four helix bundle protein [Chitinophagales bacterium]|nr:four helix bundle protein [Chitinophagales bacterium]
MGDFRSLRVWQEAKQLAVQIYEATSAESFSKDYRLVSQMRGAAVSVASNIAEGDELDTNKQSVRHFHISRGSLAELITQLITSNEIGYLSAEKSEALVKECEHISRMLRKLINARSK